MVILLWVRPSSPCGHISSSFSMQITRCGISCLGSLGIHWHSGSVWQSPGCCWQAHRHEVAGDYVDLCSGKTLISQDPDVHTLPKRKQTRKVNLAESPHMNKTLGSSSPCTFDWGCLSKQGNTRGCQLCSLLSFYHHNFWLFSLSLSLSVPISLSDKLSALFLYCTVENTGDLDQLGV